MANPMTIQTKFQASALALASKRVLKAALVSSQPHRYRLVVDEEQVSQEIELPTVVIALLVDILDRMAHGQTVQLTSQKAAAFPNISRRPFRKCGMGKGAYFKGGQNRKNQIDAQRIQILEELAAQAQELHMGY